MQPHSKCGLLALFCIFLKRVERTSFKSLHIIFMLKIIRSETFIEIDSLQHLKISSKPILRTCQKSALQHLLFSRYANFFQIMRTIHTSMTSTFYFEFIASFECKTLTILTLKCTSHGGMYSAHYLEKISTKL